MPRAREPRKAPLRKRDPLDDYSTWDVRAAKTFYYATIIGCVIIFLGIWITILMYAIRSGDIFAFFKLHPALIAAVIGGIVALHLFLLVIFYALFKGGIYRLCKVLFPDRKIAKKYEDYNVLRFLIAIFLLTVYFTVTMVIIFLIPGFIAWAFGLWIELASQWTLGIWIIWLGATMLVIIGFFLIAFVLWSHGVFFVLKKIKKIEEEIEIEEEIKVEELKAMTEEELHKAYHKETGKNAMYRGKETRSYKAWKKKRLG